MKKIDFILGKPEYEFWAEKPYPSINNLPNWYKEMNIYHSNPKTNYEKSQKQTIKRCIPFRDFLSFGYFIPLPLDVDVFFDKQSNTYEFRWLVDNVKSVEPHYHEQTFGMDVPAGFDSSASMKWDNPWIVKTPKGYSSLFLTPQLRELPFYSIPAIVDTDKFDLPINFPFFIKNEFSGTIEKGTPIVQVIPFKRDDWISDLSKKDFGMFYKNSNIRSKFMKSYQNIFWSRKKFK